MKEMMRIAFSGEGAVILKMVGVGLGSWMAGSVLSAIGKGQLSKLVNVAAVFLCLAMVFGAIASAVNKMF